MVIWVDHEATLLEMGWSGFQPVAPPAAWPAGLDAVLQTCGCAPPASGWTAPGLSPGWDHLLVAARSQGSQYDLLRGLSPATLQRLGRVACLALTGQGFHGQHGRSWQTLRGNLHLSLAVPLDLEATRCSPALVMLPAVAVVDALRVLLPRAHGNPGDLTGIKWVNDILWEGHKLSGVLTATRSEAGRITGAVFGVGLNVTAAPPATPGSPRPPGTCLARISVEETPRLGAVVSAVLAAMTRRLDQLAGGDHAPIFRAYRDQSVVVGREVVVFSESSAGDAEPPEVLHRGRVTAIGADLSLHFDNREEPLTSGRLHLVP